MNLDFLWGVWLVLSFSSGNSQRKNRNGIGLSVFGLTKFGVWTTMRVSFGRNHVPISGILVEPPIRSGGGMNLASTERRIKDILTVL